MTNKQTEPTFFPSFRARAFGFALLLTAFFLGGATVGQAQNLPVIEPASGAIDPLLDNFYPQRKGFYNPSSGVQTTAFPAGQKAALSPSAGELDASLNVLLESASGSVGKTLVQPDGKIIAAGYFRTVNGAAYKSIVRLNADLTIDATFAARLNGSITAAALQTDGKILIGGSFNTVNGASRSRIARLNADGSLDTTFNPGTGADNLIYDIAVQTDGKIIIGGVFTRVGAVYNFSVARLNADGSPDTTFVSPIPPPPFLPGQPNPITSLVNSVAVQPDGKILLGGYIITSYNGSAANFKAVSRLNVNGSFDTSFNSGSFNSNASKIALQPDGKIVVVGFFTLINQIRRNFVARLNADGSLDASFDPGTGANFPVTVLTLQADGKVIIGGRFSAINGVNRRAVARLNANGSLDETFVPSDFSTIGTIQALSVLADGRVLVGGTAFPAINVVSSAINLYNADGSSGASVPLSLRSLGGVRAIAVQTDGKIIVGGNFSRGNGLARINADGSLDPNFPPSSGFISSGAQINSIVVQPDGKILVGGIGLNIGNGFGYAVARLNADGSSDTSFTPGDIPTGRGINAMALQPDGKIVVVWGYNQNSGFPSGGAVRLNADGSLDSSFTLGIPVLLFNSVAVQPDGKILVGFAGGAFGYFSSQTGGVYYNGAARLNADGSHDRAFVPATVSDFENGRGTEVFALTLQTDGKVLIGGSLYKNGATTPTGVLRLNSNGTLDPTINAGSISSIADLARVEDIQILADGKLLVGGLFNSIGGSTHINAARLNADGSVDNSFAADTDIYSVVSDVAAQTDGKLLIGGDFETVNGIPRTSLARLLSEPLIRRTPFDFDGDGRADVSVFRPSNSTWYLLNSQTGFSGVNFGAANDKIVPADYDGDGKTDIAVYRSGTWYLNRSQLGFTGIAFGNASDIPAPADFDGDGAADLAVFRPSNGTWYLLRSQLGFAAVQFGQTGDQPAAADYDGDGISDLAVYRGGTWYIQRSQAGFTAISFGESSDKLVPADYDGDGKTDIAVFRPSNGTWYLNRSQLGFAGIAFGAAGDLPTVADYDGDGVADIAVFRNGIWYLQRSQTGFTSVPFGASADEPVPNAFVQ